MKVENIKDANKIKCKICNKLFWRITNTHLWKEHNMTKDEYNEKYPQAFFEDPIISNWRQNSKRGKKYEEIYGDDAHEQKDVRKISATHQMTDKKQINIRKEKCGYIPTEEQKLNNSLTHTTHGASNYRKRALQYYNNECARCGTDKNLIVHHMDGKNHFSELGNHNIENLMILCKSCHAKLHNEKLRGKFTGINAVEKGAMEMLKGLKKEFGLDLSDVNFKDTPKRIARAYYEIFEGINAKNEIKEILSTKFPTEYSGMVIESPINCFSMCPHHFLPVKYKVAIGYIPRKGGLGLSKLARLVELLAKAPKLQETFTQEIVDILDKEINPIGCMVRVYGEHMCMQMRGIKQFDCGTITSAVRGTFKQAEVRSEFLSLVKF